MEAVRLCRSDCALLAARYAEHGNSHRRMTAALREAGVDSSSERLRTLRELEIKFDVDLGMLCHWHEKRDASATHPVQRAITMYLTAEQPGADVWIRLDRLRELRDLLEESRLVGEPES